MRNISRRSVVAGAGVAIGGGLVGSYAMLSSGRNYPIKPGTVTVENYTQVNHKITVIVTDGPLTPREMVTIGPAPAEDGEQSIVEIADFLTEPGFYDVKGIVDDGPVVEWQDVQIWTEPDETLGGQVPQVVIQPDGSANMVLFEKYPPPGERS